MLENQITPEKQKPSAVTIVIGLIVAAAMGVSLWVLFKTPEFVPKPSAQVNIPSAMTAEEQAYRQSLRVENVALSRAENFLHQEVTILKADVINDGPRSLGKLLITVEFSDDLRQVVLRETRGVLGNPPTALGPRQKRSFEISFDRVPSSWNMQTPEVKVGYLQFTPLK